MVVRKEKKKKRKTRNGLTPKNETRSLSDQWTNNSLNRGYYILCTVKSSVHSEASVGRRNILTDEKIAKRYGCALSYIRKDVSRLHVNLFATRNRVSRGLYGREFTRAAILGVLPCFTHFGFVKRNDEGSNVSERVEKE